MNFLYIKIRLFLIVITLKKKDQNNIYYTQPSDHMPANKNRVN